MNYQINLLLIKIKSYLKIILIVHVHVTSCLKIMLSDLDKKKVAHDSVLQW